VRAIKLTYLIVQLFRRHPSREFVYKHG